MTHESFEIHTDTKVEEGFYLAPVFIKTVKDVERWTGSKVEQDFCLAPVFIKTVKGVELWTGTEVEHDFCLAPVFIEIIAWLPFSEISIGFRALDRHKR